ncbi:OmpA family protein [uncultured Bacteroides sp.]|uniref:OmpA family protein n=1 Tax=uncultured Bacteroides sp. TaxID=162156 RepID=UPI00261DF64A|nr:OmpA family protein [uncultured Bacteroides sp.]
MKKRSLLAIAFAACTLAAGAQDAYVGNKFFDNWSLGYRFGGITPLAHSAFFKGMRATTGLELSKQLTPTFGLSFEGLAAINTSVSSNAFDAANLGVNGRVNLYNLFGGYQGTPRCFEIEAVAGLGLGHDFNNQGYTHDRTYIVSRFGFNFNFNMGEQKAWIFNIRPALVYRSGGEKYDGSKQSERLALSKNRGAFELLAGITYHFKNSNGEHYMTIQKPYNQDEVDGLNKTINDLRAANARQNEAISAANAENARLQNAVVEAQNTAKQVETIVKNTHSKSLESVVTFRQGRTTISADQLPNVERIATYMKNNPKSTVSIKGYASPEGSAEVNARIAQQRADAVKNMLINKYKIKANRITAEGQGVGDLFSEPDWNRVSVATLSENDAD